MISQTAEYALRAIVFLAKQPEIAQTTTQIAEATQVPAGYLAKVMQSLARTKIVNSQRGLKGGFTLGMSPEELTVLSIVSAVDPIRRYPECPLGIKEHGRRLCPLHKRLDQAGEMVEEAFGSTSIAELIMQPKKQGALCSFPLGSKSPR